MSIRSISVQSPLLLSAASFERLVGRARRLPSVRTQKVAEIRAALQNGRYELDRHLDAIVPELARELRAG